MSIPEIKIKTSGRSRNKVGALGRAGGVASPEKPLRVAKVLLLIAGFLLIAHGWLELATADRQIKDAMSQVLAKTPDSQRLSIEGRRRLEETGFSLAYAYVATYVAVGLAAVAAGMRLKDAPQGFAGGVLLLFGIVTLGWSYLGLQMLIGGILFKGPALVLIAVAYAQAREVEKRIAMQATLASHAPPPLPLRPEVRPEDGGLPSATAPVTTPLPPGEALPSADPDGPTPAR
ncbi:MAG: hypothetical protein JNK76_11425 [Planctomycetales bacterium]|nr:hypothetical protein [Planctomycetales bacterium]MBN8628478.1 hypothetical protein [Planctomycetota bacterium]